MCARLEMGRVVQTSVTAVIHQGVAEGRGAVRRAERTEKVGHTVKGKRR